MTDAKSSDSDVTSSFPSSPRSPKPPLYYVQSPSRNSNDDEKSSSIQNSPPFTSPMESPSPSHSYARHSITSSASRVSGSYARTSNYGGGGRKHPRFSKRWPAFHKIEEEGEYEERFGDNIRRRQVLIGVSTFVAIFCVICLMLWGASKPFEPVISVKSLNVHNFYYGQGSDLTGVPTRMVTMNSTLKMSVYNPATFFDIHISSVPVYLMYSEIVVASGQSKSYYQPRKSHRMEAINLKGKMVPLYGAGASLAVSNNNGGVVMKLIFVIHSRGYVVGKLVKSRHRRHVNCSLILDSHTNVKVIMFKNDSCTYT